MDQAAITSRIAELNQLIEVLESRLLAAQSRLHECMDASAQLSINAAKARAQNQGAGRGLDGILLGSKYRAVVRREAARSNANISRQVSQKRAEIVSEKGKAQDEIRILRVEISNAKKELQSLSKLNRRHIVEKRQSENKKGSNVDLLAKLKEAHDLGLLTDAEYEEKRKKLVDEI